MSDRKAAFTGLIVGAVALAALVITIVLLTNARYAKGEAATPAASTTR